MYFDKAKIIQAAQEKEKRRLIFKAWHFKVFLYNGLEKASIHTNTKGQKEKPEEFQKLDAHCFLAVYFTE